MKERAQPEAERDADVAVSDLGGVGDVGPAARGKEEREQRVRQHHQPATQPAEVLGADEAALLRQQPRHQPVDAAVECPGPEQHDERVEVEHGAEGPLLPHVVLEHVEDLEALPEEKQANQDEAVAGSKFAVRPECPRHAGKEQACDQREEQRQPVELGAGIRFPGSGATRRRAGGLLARGPEAQAPAERGQGEDEGEIGDVVDQAVGQHLGGRSPARGDQSDEDQVTEPGAIRHDQRAQCRPLESMIEHRLQAPDHQQRRAEEKPEIGPDARQAGLLDRVRERIHRGTSSSR